MAIATPIAMNGAAATRNAPTADITPAIKVPAAAIKAGTTVINFIIPVVKAAAA